MTTLTPAAGKGAATEGWRTRGHRRAMRLAEDVVRCFPVGVPTPVIVERLARVGLSEHEAHSLLDELARTHRLVHANGRWALR